MRIAVYADPRRAEQHPGSQEVFRARKRRSSDRSAASVAQIVGRQVVPRPTADPYVFIRRIVSRSKGEHGGFGFGARGCRRANGGRASCRRRPAFPPTFTPRCIRRATRSLAARSSARFSPWSRGSPSAGALRPPVKAAARDRCAASASPRAARSDTASARRIASSRVATKFPRLPPDTVRARPIDIFGDTGSAGPLAAPNTTICPRTAAACKSPVKVVFPTASKITSAPCPEVSRFTSATKSTRVYTITSSGPHRARRALFPRSRRCRSRAPPVPRPLCQQQAHPARRRMH